MTEVLLTGGNGFVGRHVVSALLARGDGVRVLALPDEDTLWLNQRGVAVHRGDVRRPETLSEAMRGVERVLHLAAMMDVWRPLEDYHAVNVTGTVNVCRAALAVGVSRLVHMSSSSVYGVGLGYPADESAPLAPFPDPYPITKALGDVAVQRMIDDERLPAAILRPDQIFGPGDDLHFGRMADRLRAGRSVIVGSGKNLVPLVYVTDAVQALLLALDLDRAAGQVYNVTNDHRLTQRELLDAIAHDLGAPPPRLRVPYRAVYAAGYLAERVAGMLPGERRPRLTRLGVAFFGADDRYPIDKARRELGYAPQVDLRDGVRLAADWYRERHGPQRSEQPPAIAARAAQEART